MKDDLSIRMELMMLYSRRDTLSAEWARGEQSNPLYLTDVWAKIHALRWALGENVQWGVGEQEAGQNLLSTYGHPGEGKPGPALALYGFALVGDGPLVGIKPDGGQRVLFYTSVPDLPNETRWRLGTFKGGDSVLWQEESTQAYYLDTQVLGWLREPDDLQHPEEGPAA